MFRHDSVVCALAACAALLTFANPSAQAAVANAKAEVVDSGGTAVIPDSGTNTDAKVDLSSLGVISDGGDVDITPIGDTEPIVTIEEVDGQLILKLTNIEIESLKPTVNNVKINFEADWTHGSTGAVLTASLDGTFTAATASDFFSINLTGMVDGAGSVSTDVETGTGTQPFDAGSDTDVISVSAGTTKVTGMLTFTMTGVGSKFLIPDSGVVNVAVPAPSALAAGFALLMLTGARRSRAR